MKKSFYHHLSCIYNAEKSNGEIVTTYSSWNCKTNETMPAGIPTMGYLIKKARIDAEAKGWKYVEGSLAILSIMKLTKAQYEAILDTNEPEKML